MMRRLKYGFLTENSELMSDVCFKVPTASFSDILWKSLSSSADKPLLVDGETGQEMSRADIKAHACTFASVLLDMGLQEGDIVSCCCENTISYMTAIIGIHFAAGVYTSCYYGHSKREWLHMVSELHARILICSESNLQTASEVADEVDSVIGIIVLPEGRSNENEDENTCSRYKRITGITCKTRQGKAVCSVSLADSCFPSTHSLPAKMSQAAEDALFYVPFSSGSTGLPKGVLLTHRNVACHIASLLTKRDLPDDHVELCSLGFGCVPGLYQMYMGILAGYVMVSSSGFDTRTFWHMIADYKCTHAWLTPSEMNRLSQSSTAEGLDLASLREVRSVGSIHLAPTVESFKQLIKHDIRIKAIYGTTETNAICQVSEDVDDDRTVGIMLPGLELRVFDHQRNENAGSNEKGEIQIRGENMVTRGYYLRPSAQRDNFTDDGWFRTGDIGYFDDQGMIFLIGRLKEVIKVDGFQVSPADIESLLLSHESVAEAAVVGVPDDIYCEAPKAYVVLKEERLTTTAEEIRRFVDQQVSELEQLRGGIEILQSMPMISFGKIDRKKLKLMSAARIME